MNERSENVTISHHDFKSLMREYGRMALELNHKRHLAKCAALCLNQVATSVTSGDNDKDLCYYRDNDYIHIARDCIK